MYARGFDTFYTIIDALIRVIMMEPQTCHFKELS